MGKGLLENLITRSEAMDRLLAEWKPENKTELIKLEDALDRVVAEDILAKNTLPVYRASRADGIAVKKEDFQDGLPDTRNWVKGIDYAQADTGDDFPDAFDAVIMIENVSYDEEGHLILGSDTDVHHRSLVKPAGTTVKAGELILSKNSQIREIHLAALATGGITQLVVYQKPKVVYIPTGNELVPRGTAPQRGNNVESNGIMVKAMLEKAGAEVICYPIIRDDLAELTLALEKALLEADLVLINAGSAKGEEDYTHVLLNEYSKVLQHGVAAAPGRPICLALSGNKPIINIPGPTIGAYYAVDWCVSALVKKLLQQPMEKREVIEIALTAEVKAMPALETFIRIKAFYEGDVLKGAPIPFDASFPETARECNALLIIPQGVEGYKKGEEVTVELLYGRANIEL